jgi:hypothetical protein
MNRKPPRIPKRHNTSLAYPHSTRISRHDPCNPHLFAPHDFLVEVHLPLPQPKIIILRSEILRPTSVDEQAIPFAPGKRTGINSDRSFDGSIRYLHPTESTSINQQCEIASPSCREYSFQKASAFKAANDLLKRALSNCFDETANFGPQAATLVVN